MNCGTTCCANKLYCTVNVDCVKFEYVVLAKYHHMHCPKTLGNKILLLEIMLYKT
jgi:hypothetical protein